MVVRAFDSLISPETYFFDVYFLGKDIYLQYSIQMSPSSIEYQLRPCVQDYTSPSEAAEVAENHSMRQSYL